MPPVGRGGLREPSGGRPPLPEGEKKTRRWLFLRNEQWERLDEEAEKRGVTVSQLIEILIDERPA